MKKLNIIFFLSIMLAFYTASGQIKSGRFRSDRNWAEKALKSALTNTRKGFNFISNDRILIKDSNTAVNIAEPILFSVYGKDDIIFERPYDIFFINKYWIISGTLPIDYNGGTFLIIMDSRNCKIISLEHGK